MIVVRLVVILAGLILIATMVARWWFWDRVRLRGQRTPCSLSVAELYERLGIARRKPSDLRDAAALGVALREAGLRLMERDGTALARRRRAGWWNLRILPGLLALVFVFSFFSGKKHASMWVLGGGAFLVALHVVLRVAGLGTELQAVRRGWQELERSGGLRRSEEAEAVLRCARASVWDTVLPW